MIEFGFLRGMQDGFLVQTGFPLLCGFAMFVYFASWKAISAKWTNWFPVLRAASKYIMYGLAAVLFGATAITLLASRRIELAGTLLAVGLGFGLILKVTQRQKEGELRERGAAIVPAAEVAAMTKKKALGNAITFGGVKLPTIAEPFHLLIAGSTGSGKSVAIKGLLDTLRERGETAIIVDSGGEMVERYWDAMTDHIINPFDHRCVAWSPMSELEGVWDTEAMARSIIPDGTGDAKEWNGYAQTLVASVMKTLLARGDLSLKSLLVGVQTAPLSEMKDMLAGTAAASQVDSEKMFGSIRTIASNYLTPFNYLADEPSSFSVRKFIEGQKGGFLYLPYREDQLDSLKNLIAFVLDIASRAILSMPPDSDRRTWLIIDEFASIGKVQSIEAVATKARKSGGCLLLGVQSVSQIKDRYGEHAAQSILACLSTWLVLRCVDGDTAEYMSRYLGEQQVRQILMGQSFADNGRSDSVNTTIQNRRVVMASEIQDLPNCTGFLRVTGGYPICSVKLSFPKPASTGAPLFIPRDFKSRPMVDLASKREEAPSVELVTAPTPTAPKQQQDAPGFVARVSALQAAYEAEEAKPGGGSDLKKQSILDDLDGLMKAMAR